MKVEVEFRFICGKIKVSLLQLLERLAAWKDFPIPQGFIEADETVEFEVVGRGVRNGSPLHVLHGDQVFPGIEDRTEQMRRKLSEESPCPGYCASEDAWVLPVCQH